jgi:hypothetical protein
VCYFSYIKWQVIIIFFEKNKTLSIKHKKTAN